MNERISIADKKPEVKNQDICPQIRRKTESQSMNSPVDRLLFLQRTIGNQAVGKLIKSGALQAKLRIGTTGDIYEQEADRVAEQVMQMPDVSKAKDTRIQRKCPKCLNGLRGLLGKDKKDEKLQVKETDGQTHEVTPKIEANINGLKGGGQPLPESTRAFFEPRFGRDFSQVLVHTDAKAAESAQMVNAKAYTVGQDVVFGEGEYALKTSAGQKLLGHELVHVLQQKNDGVMLNRQGTSSGSTLASGFCTPFSSRAEAQSVHNEALIFFIPAITAVFGSEVGSLWLRYLRRRRGDSLAPIVFSSPSSEIVRGFMNSQTTQARQNELTEIILRSFMTRCPRLPRHNVWIDVPVTRYLSNTDLNFPIDFNQVFEIPGNIAGGAGSSDAGPDFRRVSGNVSFIRRTDALGNTIDIIMRTNFSFLARDAVDFCPGQPGAGIEQHLTIPLSRLEASGLAYDVPFEVRYKPNPIFRSLDPAIINRCFPGRGASSSSASLGP